MTPNVFQTCKWLIEKLLKKRYMTLEEINEECKNDRTLANGVEMRRRSLYNYRKMIKESFGIEIVPVNHISKVIARVLPEALSNNRKKSA